MRLSEKKLFVFLYMMHKKHTFMQGNRNKFYIKGADHIIPVTVNTNQLPFVYFVLSSSCVSLSLGLPEFSAC